MRSVLHCMPEAVEGRLWFAGGLEVMRSALLCMPEAVEGELCLLEVLEVMRCMLLCMCMLEAVEGGLSFVISKFPLRQFSRYARPPCVIFLECGPGRPGEAHEVVSNEV